MPVNALFWGIKFILEFFLLKKEEGLYAERLQTSSGLHMTASRGREERVGALQSDPHDRGERESRRGEGAGEQAG